MLFLFFVFFENEGFETVRLRPLPVADEGSKKNLAAVEILKRRIGRLTKFRAPQCDNRSNNMCVRCVVEKKIPSGSRGEGGGIPLLINLRFYGMLDSVANTVRQKTTQRAKPNHSVNAETTGDSYEG